MPVSAETLRLLMDAGVEGDELLRIVESIDRTPTKERSSNAERQARFRAKRKAQGVTSNVTNSVTDSVTPHVRGEDNLLPKKISGKEEKKEGAAKPRVDLDGFKAELSPILDPDRIDALVAVRRKKGAVLSAHAGRLLRDALVACPDASAAADEMVLRNWTGIKPDWLQKRTTGPPRAGKPNAFDAYEQIARERGWNEPEIVPSPDSDAQRFSPEQRGYPSAVVDLRTGTDWHRR